jgi:hypothetical protein
MVMKKIIFFLITGLFALQINCIYSQTEFAPIGAEWYYTNTDSDPGYSCEKYVSTKDSTIEGKECKMILHYKVSSQIDTLFFWQNEEKVYYYRDSRFFLLYDFNVNIGDTLTFSFKKSEFGESPYEIIPVKCVVHDVQFTNIDGKELKMIFTNIIDEISAYFHIKNGTYNYIEKIGHPKIFMEEVIETWTTMAYTTGLRCYYDNEINYITDWWTKYDLPCDYYGRTNIFDIISNNYIQIFPNPTCDFITINIINEDIAFNYQLYDIQGKTLKQGKLKSKSHIIDIRDLNNGIYFVNIKNEKQKSLIKKIIKQ